MNAVASPMTLSTLFEELGKRRKKIESLSGQIDWLGSLTVDTKLQAVWAIDDAGEHRGQIFYLEQQCERLIGEFIKANSFDRENQGAIIVAMSSLLSFDLAELRKLTEIFANKTKNNDREPRKLLQIILSIDLDQIFLILEEMRQPLAEIEYMKKYPDIAYRPRGAAKTLEEAVAKLKAVHVKLESFIAQSLKTLFPVYSHKADLIIETADLSEEQLLELTALAKKMKENKAK